MKMIHVFLFFVICGVDASNGVRSHEEKIWTGFKSNFYNAIRGDDYNRLERTLTFKCFPFKSASCKEVFTFLAQDEASKRSPLEYAVAAGAHKSIIKLLCSVFGGDELKKAYQSSSLLTPLFKEGLVAVEKKTNHLSKENAQQYKRCYVTFVITAFLNHNLEIGSVEKDDLKALEQLGLQSLKEKIEHVSLFKELPGSNALVEDRDNGCLIF